MMWQDFYALMRPIAMSALKAVFITVMFTLIITPVMMVWVRSLSWSRVAAIVLLALVRAAALSSVVVNVVWRWPGRSFDLDASEVAVTGGLLIGVLLIILDFNAAKENRPERTTRWWLVAFVPSLMLLVAASAFWLAPQDERWRIAMQLPEAVRGRPSYVVAALDSDYLRDVELGRGLGQMQDALRLATPRVLYAGSGRSGDTLRVVLVTPADADRAERLLSEALPHDEFRLSRAQDGAIEAALAPGVEQHLINWATPVATDAIARRLGAGRPSIVRVASIGSNRILIQEFGVSADVIRSKLAIVGLVTMHEVVDDESPPRNPPPGFILAPAFPGFEAGSTMVRRRPWITGDKIAAINVSSDVQTGLPVIQFRFNAAVLSHHARADWATVCDFAGWACNHRARYQRANLWRIRTDFRQLHR